MSDLMHDAVQHDDAAEDAALARRVAGGDASAEAALCRRLLPRVRAWGLKHLRDETGALDLAQQVVMTVLEALRAGRVIELDRVGAFVMGVCKRTVLSWRAGQHRRAELLDRFGAGLVGTSELVDHGIDRRRLARCFERLQPRARTVLALAFFVERSTDEIATELSVSAGNVRVIRHRALDQLQACMEGNS